MRLIALLLPCVFCGVSGSLVQHSSDHLRNGGASRGPATTVDFMWQPNSAGPAANVPIFVRAGLISDHRLGLVAAVNIFAGVNGRMRVTAKPITWNGPIDETVKVPMQNGLERSVKTWGDLFSSSYAGWSANYMMLQQIAQPGSQLNVSMNLLGPLEGELIGELLLGVKVSARCYKTARTVTVVQGVDGFGRGVVLIVPNNLVKKTVGEWSQGWLVVIENQVTVVAASANQFEAGSDYMPGSKYMPGSEYMPGSDIYQTHGVSGVNVPHVDQVGSGKQLSSAAPAWPKSAPENVYVTAPVSVSLPGQGAPQSKELETEADVNSMGVALSKDSQERAAQDDKAEQHSEGEEPEQQDAEADKSHDPNLTKPESSSVKASTSPKAASSSPKASTLSEEASTSEQISAVPTSAESEGPGDCISNVAQSRDQLKGASGDDAQDGLEKSGPIDGNAAEDEDGWFVVGEDVVKVSKGEVQKVGGETRVGGETQDADDSDSDDFDDCDYVEFEEDPAFDLGPEGGADANVDNDANAGNEAAAGSTSRQRSSSRQSESKLVVAAVDGAALSVDSAAQQKDRSDHEGSDQEGSDIEGGSGMKATGNSKDKDPLAQEEEEKPPTKVATGAQFHPDQHAYRHYDGQQASFQQQQRALSDVNQPMVYNQLTDTYQQYQNGHQQYENGYLQGQNGYLQGHNGYLAGNDYPEDPSGLHMRGPNEQGDGYFQDPNAYQQGTDAYQQPPNGYQHDPNGYMCQYSLCLAPGGIVPTGARYHKTMIDKNRQIEFTAGVWSISTMGRPAKLDLSVYAITPNQIVSAAIVGASDAAIGTNTHWGQLTNKWHVERPKVFTAASGTLSSTKPYSVRFDWSTQEGNPLVQQLDMFLTRLSNSVTAQATFCSFELKSGDKHRVFAIVSRYSQSDTCHKWLYGWAVVVSAV